MSEALARSEEYSQIGRVAWAQGDHAGAGDALRTAVLEAERDGDSEQLAAALADLGTIEQQAKHLDAAEALFARALEVRERLHGTEDESIAQSLAQLSSVRLARGQYADAEPLLRRLLAIKSATGEDRAEVATVMASLGAVSRALGRHAVAEQLWRRVLAIREKTLAPNHFAIATSLEQLADSCAARGKLHESISLLERALAIRERTLGPTHPSLIAVRARVADLQLQAADSGDLDTMAAMLGGSTLPPITWTPPVAVPPPVVRAPAIPPLAAPIAPAPVAPTPPAPAATATTLVTPAVVVPVAPPPAPVPTPVPAAAPAPAPLPTASALDAALESLRALAVDAGSELEPATEIDASPASDGERDGGAVPLALPTGTAEWEDEPVPARAAAAGRLRVAIGSHPTLAAATLGGVIAVGVLVGMAARDAASERLPVSASAPLAAPAVTPTDTSAALAHLVDAGAIAKAPVESAPRAVPSRAAGPTSGRPAESPAPVPSVPAVREVPIIAAPVVPTAMNAKALIAGIGDRDRAGDAAVRVAPAILTSDSPSPVYPAMLRESGVKGRVVAEFVVDVNGRADPRTFTVLESSGDLFTIAVRNNLPRLRFIPADSAGQRIPWRVRLPITFEVVDR